MQEQEGYWGAALHHYFSKSMYDFHLKMQRRSGDGGAKSLSELIRVAVQCTKQCIQAVAQGEQLDLQYDLAKNAPQTCINRATAYQSLGGPWTKWKPLEPPGTSTDA